jgi:hypothetical protein
MCDRATSSDPTERRSICERSAFGIEEVTDDDVARAIAALAEFPPDLPVRVGGCCGG